MKLEEAKELAEDLLKEYSSNPESDNPFTLTAKGWKFKFDNAKVRFGLCDYEIKTIQLSRHLTLMNDRNKVEDTIRHEIAHILAGARAGHGYLWKRKAIECGAIPKSCYGKETKNVRGRFIYQCPNCEKKVYKHRVTRRAIACGDCCDKYNHGRFNRRFVYNYLGVDKSNDITEELMKIYGREK